MPLRDSVAELFRHKGNNAGKESKTAKPGRVEYESKWNNGEAELSEIKKSQLENLNIKASYPGDDDEKREFEIHGSDYFKQRRFFAFQKGPNARQTLKDSVLICTDLKIQNPKDLKENIRKAFESEEGDRTISASFIPETSQLILTLISENRDDDKIHHGIRSGTHRDTEVGVLFAKALNQYDATGQTTQTVQSPAEFMPPSCLSFDIFSTTQRGMVINALEETLSPQIAELLRPLDISCFDKMKGTGDNYLLRMLLALGESWNFPDFKKLPSHPEVLAKWFVGSIVSAQDQKWEKVSKKCTYSTALAPSACGIYSSFDEHGQIINLYDVVNREESGTTREVLQYIQFDLESMENNGLPRAGIIFRSDKTNSYRFVIGSNHPDILRWENSRTSDYGERQKYQPLYEFDARLKINFAQLAHSIGPSSKYWGFRENRGNVEPQIDMPNLPLILEVVDYRGYALGSKEYKTGNKDQKAVEESRTLVLDLAQAQYENAKELDLMVKP